MKYVIVLITLSAAHPCPPASLPTFGCLDFVTRMDAYSSLDACQQSAVWWRWRIQESMQFRSDTGNAICVQATSMTRTHARSWGVGLTD
jgi:hypothetical protein